MNNDVDFEIENLKIQDDYLQQISKNIFKIKSSKPLKMDKKELNSYPMDILKDEFLMSLYKDL